MPILTVTNLGSATLGIGLSIGKLGGRSAKTVTLTVAQIEELRDTLVELAGRGLVSWSVETNSTLVDDGAEFAPIGRGLSVTSAPLDLYVTTTGSDTNEGQSSSQPLRSLARVFDLIPDQINHPVVVHLGNGTYDLTGSLQGVTLKAPLMFIGDGAGQGSDDGFVEVATGVAQAGTGAAAVVTTGGLAVDEYIDYFIEFTSGNAEGYRRQIRDNTTTTITPAYYYNNAPADGDSYRIVRPAVTINMPESFNTTVTAGFFNVKGSGVVDVTDTVNYGENRLTFTNLDFSHEPGLFIGALALRNTDVSFYGCRLANPPSSSAFQVGDSSVALGLSDSSAKFSTLPVSPGLASELQAWSGYGLVSIGAHPLSGVRTQWEGFLNSNSANSVFLVQGTHFRMRGGRIKTTTSTDCFEIKGFANVSINGIFASASTPPLITNETNAADASCLLVRGGSSLDLGARCVIRKTNAGYCLVVSANGSGQNAEPGRASVASTTFEGVTSTAAPTGGMVVTNGGVISCRRTGTSFSGFAAGTQIGVRKGGITGTVMQQGDFGTLLTAAGDAIPAVLATDGRQGRDGWIRGN